MFIACAIAISALVSYASVWTGLGRGDLLSPNATVQSLAIGAVFGAVLSVILMALPVRGRTPLLVCSSVLLLGAELIFADALSYVVSWTAAV